MIQVITQILQQHPDGISEYQLIQQLRKQQVTTFVEADLRDPLSLFQAHFFLFHLLYRLRDNLHEQQLACLDIHTLRILLKPWQTGESGLCPQDPLRLYYLDLEQLKNTDRDAVEQLLEMSHLRLQDQGAADAALKVLGFERHVIQPNAQQIRLRYRQQVSRHHPDRGGCTRQVQAFNHAYAVLKKQGYLD